MNNSEGRNKLEELRTQIDLIDNDLVEILATRMNLMPEFAKCKEICNLPIEDKGREQEILKRVKQIAQEKGLDSNFAEKTFLNLFEEAKKVQKDIVNNSP